MKAPPTIDRAQTRYIAYRALAGFTCQTPVIALFYLAHGIDYRGLLTLALAFAAAKICFDIPAGLFADRVGRRPALFARVAIEAFSVLVLFDGRLLLSSMLAGIACSFSSSAESALVYESHGSNFARVFGRAGAVGFLSTALAALVGAAAATADLRLAFVLRLGALVAAAVMVARLVEPPRVRTTDRRVPLPLAWRPFLITGLLGAVHVAALQLHQPFLREQGMPLAAFGILYVLFQVTTAWGSKVASQVSSPMAVVVGCSIAGFAIMAAPLGAGAVAGILLLKFAHGISLPTFGKCLNEAVPAQSRATCLSLRSLFEGSALVLTAPLLGWAADAVCLQAAFAVAALLVFPALLWTSGVVIRPVFAKEASA